MPRYIASTQRPQSIAKTISKIQAYNRRFLPHYAGRIWAQGNRLVFEAEHLNDAHNLLHKWAYEAGASALVGSRVSPYEDDSECVGE